MKKSRILAIIAMVLLLTLCFVACKKENPHACESKCAECGKCTDAACTEDACAAKCAGHKPAGGDNTGNNGGNTDGGNTDGGNTDGGNGGQEEVKTTPVISVVPAELEINAGEEIDLMFGVSVTDEGDEAPTLIIDDDNDFDADVEGVYIITYLARNKHGNSATATRKVTVNKALPIYTLEVKENKLGEAKWQGTKLNFKNHEYVELSGDATYSHSGIFHNGTDAEITINVEGNGYDAVAIINANGVVLEGRDGPNGRLVNAENPVRANSTASIGVNDTGKDIKIPAGCYAIVVRIDYAGVGADFDGRNFIGHNVIYQVGNVVRITLEGQDEALTPYADQAPVISGHTTTIYAANSEFDLNGSVLAGVKAIDDNGTFDPTDDVEVEVTVAENGGFDIEDQGVYEIVLSATDANDNAATVVRKVEVTTEIATVTIGSNSYDTLEDLVAIDQDLTVLGKYLFIIYTPAYEGDLNWSNGFGEAFVINKSGAIFRLYAGANGKYYDLENTAGIVDATKCTAAGYLTEAFNSLGADEYLLVAPNGNGNVTRQFLLDNRVIGAKVAITGFEFAAHECLSVCSNPDCGKCLDEACTEADCKAKCECHKCESICAICGLCTDAACTEYFCTNKCEGHAHACESVCAYCSGCKDAECTDEACVTKCAGHTGHMLMTVGSKKYEAEEGKWAKNTEITASNATSKAIWIFEYGVYTGSVATNQWGVALVLDSEYKVARIYDGANGGYTDKDSGVNNKEKGVTTANFATLAWESLAEGETLVILPNGGSANNAARQVGLDCRWLIGQKMNLDVLD